MKLSTVLFIVLSIVEFGVGKRIQVTHELLTVDTQQVTHELGSVEAQPANRSDLPRCPCTIWRHCQPEDVLPENPEVHMSTRAGEEEMLARELRNIARGDGLGVACCASADAIISMGHQVQCAPPRHGGVNYYCPPILPFKCDPQAECLHTELTSCSAGDCEEPAWLPKTSTTAFCAMDECTHAECCDQGPTPVTDEAPPASEGPTCSSRVHDLAESTLSRINAYITDCGFISGDVNFGGDVDLSSGRFDLTTIGQEKLWEEHCQHVPSLQESPDNVFLDAQDLLIDCPDQRRLRSQLSSVGIFATASVLDHFFRMCADQGLASCQPPRSTTPVPTTTPVARLTTVPPATIPPTTTSAPLSCIGDFSFTLQLGHSHGQTHEQAFSLGSAIEGAVEHLQCDAGPFIYGTLDMMCQNANWVMMGRGAPCFDTAQEAEHEDSSTEVYVPEQTEVLRLVDVTAILTRVQDDPHASVTCCCNERLDATLQANSWSHTRWNNREHTGICTIHENIWSCSWTDSDTHSHDRTEGAQCIVREDARENWARILQLTRPTTEAGRFEVPDVPLLPSGQTAEDFRDCVPAQSLAECDRCTHNVQCPEEWYCCPFLKMCVEDSTTRCPARNMASCQNCFERFHPNPEECESSCDNPAFPRRWLPECHSGGGGWFR